MKKDRRSNLFVQVIGDLFGVLADGSHEFLLRLRTKRTNTDINEDLILLPDRHKHYPYLIVSIYASFIYMADLKHWR